MKKLLFVASFSVLFFFSSCDLIQNKILNQGKQEQNTQESLSIEQYRLTPETYVAPKISSQHKVYARRFFWVFDGSPAGKLKLSHEYNYVDLIIYDDGSMTCDGNPVRYSIFDNYDYECNNGNSGYVFNASDIY